MKKIIIAVLVIVAVAAVAIKVLRMMDDRSS